MEPHLQKLIDDGVITVDDEGVVRLTKSAFTSMLTSTAHLEVKPNATLRGLQGRSVSHSRKNIW